MIRRNASFTQDKYLSCPHVTKEMVLKAHNMTKNMCLAFCTYGVKYCVECGIAHTKTNEISHKNNNGHHLAVRNGTPYELYCYRCGDYIFCSLFDKLCGRRRPSTAKNDGVTSLRENNTIAHSNSVSTSSSKGLVNMGSTCFMNSVMQVISRCSALVDHPQLIEHLNNCLLVGSKNKNYDDLTNSTIQTSTSTVNGNVNNVATCIPCEFKLLADALRACDGEDGALIPSNLLFSVWNYVDYLVGYAQQDAHEFLIALITCLEAQLVSSNTSSSLSSNTSFPLNQAYSGETQSNLTCRVCKQQRTNREPFVDLNLSVIETSRARSPKVGKRRIRDDDDVSSGWNNLDSLTLFDCLSHFTVCESLSEKLFCPTCNADQEFSKQLSISRFPPILILHLKRFDFLKQKKINARVSFPINGLDLNMFTTEFLMNEEDSNYPVYDLQGIVCHKGNMHQGHYIAYVREVDYDENEQSYWMRCDDEKVVAVTVEEVEASEGYLLIYQRRKNSKTPDMRII